MAKKVLLLCTQGRFLFSLDGLVDITAQLLVEGVSPRTIPCRTMKERLQSVDHQSHAAEPRDDDSSASMLQSPKLSVGGKK